MKFKVNDRVVVVGVRGPEAGRDSRGLVCEIIDRETMQVRLYMDGGGSAWFCERELEFEDVLSFNFGPRIPLEHIGHILVNLGHVALASKSRDMFNNAIKSLGKKKTQP